MEYVLSSLLGKRFTFRHRQAWSYLFQQIIVDLGRGVEQEIANQAKVPQHQNNIHQKLT